MVRKILGLSLAGFLAGVAGAQDRQFPAALGAGIPPLGPTSPRVMPPVRNFNRGFPLYWGGYGAVYPAMPEYPTMPAPPVTNVVVFEPPPAAPPPPPPPIHSSIQELNIPEVNPAAASEPPAFFVIALKDGSRHSAVAVWVQQNQLRYVDADDQNQRVPLAEVDRAATRELNQARHLNLRLPPAQ